MRFVTRNLIVALLAGGLCLSASAWAQPLSEPVGPFAPTTIADDRVVELLVATLNRPEAERDIFLRERLVRDLASTRNIRILPALRRALQDDAWQVRVAAVQALGRLPLDWVAADLRAALASPDDRVAAQAVRAVRAQQWAEPSGELTALTTRANPRLAALALTTLTHIGQPLPADRLASLLGPERALTVRLAAARNAALASAEPVLVEALEALAGENPATPPSLRRVALAGLGRLQAGPAQALLMRAATDPDWAVRAGAAEGLGSLGRSGLLIRLLSDPQPPVRLEAMRSIQRNTDPAALDRLWHNYADPIEANHQAARDALLAIGSPEVAVRAATELREHADKISGSGGEADDFHRRQATAASYLLGRLQSTEDIEYHAALLDRLPGEEPLLTQVAESLGQIGDRRAIPHLQGYFQRETQTARRHFQNFNNPFAFVAFNEETYANVLLTLALLDAPQAEQRAIETLRFRHAGMRFVMPNVVAMDVLEMLGDRLGEGQFGQVLAEVAGDRSYDDRDGGLARWHAASLLGRHRLREGLEPLRRMLEVERTSPEMIRMAGWSVQEITGTTPDLPSPVPTPARNLAIWSLQE